jgi:hypothetical protein
MASGSARFRPQTMSLGSVSSKGWGCTSVMEHLSRISKALCSIPKSKKKIEFFSLPPFQNFILFNFQSVCGDKILTTDSALTSIFFGGKWS